MISSFIYSEYNNSYIEDYNDNIILYIDPFNINTFTLNKFFPNQNQDIRYYSIKFDGSTFSPLSQSIPSKIHFNLNDKGNFSQLIYNQRKADNFFDSSIAMKNNINNNVDMLLQVETKSIVDNINQNFFLDYNKQSEKFNIDFSYMYHYEKDPENYEIINYNSSFLKEFESYNSGFGIEYFFKNFNLVSNFSSQISSNKRPELLSDNYSYINYDAQVFWNENEIEYLLNENSNLYLKNTFKKNIIENDEEFLKGYTQNIISSGYSYNWNSKFVLDLSIDNLNNKILPSLFVQYKSKKIQMNLSLDNQLISYLSDTNELFGNYNLYEIQKYNYNTIFNFENIHNSLDLGYIKSDDFNYKYILLNGLLNMNKIMIDYKYYIYSDIETIDLGINEYKNYGISYYPFKNKYKFELYGKINFYQYNIDSSLNLLELNPFNSEIIEYKNVSLYNTEIGFIFDSFTILYKSNNILNKEIKYSNLINPFQRLDYINIIWVFDE